MHYHFVQLLYSTLTCKTCVCPDPDGMACASKQDAWPTAMFTIMDRAQTCNNHNSISRTRMIKSRLSITHRIIFWM
jgi:hypothetical protein